MARYSVRQQFRYRFDTFIGRGGSSIFLTLLLVFLGTLVALSLLRGLIYLIYPDGAQHIADFLGHVYIVFLELTDPGNMNQDIPSSPIYKMPGIIAGFAGLILLSMLIAFITTALDQKLAELRKGLSKVIEEDHTVILGWNPERILEILRELILANESEPDGCVVILAEHDKVEMDDYLNLHLSERQTTRVLTRSGKISAPVSLEKVNIPEAKSVIVLATVPEDSTRAEKAGSDVKVIKSVLALLTSRPEGKRLNIVAEIFEARNRTIITDMSPDEITTVDTSEILAKILVQTSRSIGLSVVYGEIMSFDGCEMYFAGAEWGDITFGQVQFRFPDGIPMAIRRSDGTIMVNPEPSTAMLEGDEVVILAEDDSTIDFQAEPVVQPQELQLRDMKQEQGIERELLVGWNPKAETVLSEYADYLLPGSTINVMCLDPDGTVQRRVEAINERLDKISIGFINKSPIEVESLVSVEPFNYDNIIILSHGDSLQDAEKTDSETIITLLLLRKIFGGYPEESASTKLITEILDSENQDLVARAGVNDFIISTKVVSMLLAQISEGPDIAKVYDDLFEEDGSEIYLKPASLYSETFPAKISFADAMALAQKRNEVCLGVKIKELEKDADQNFGVKLNPAKDTRYMLQPHDSLVVLAEDET